MRNAAIALIFCLLAASPAVAEGLPVLEPGALVHVEGKPLSIGHTAEVEVVDWNNDGKLDLLVGTFAGGRVHLFLNEGTNQKPVLSATGRKLTAGGKELTAGFG